MLLGWEGGSSDDGKQELIREKIGELKKLKWDKGWDCLLKEGDWARCRCNNNEKRKVVVGKVSSSGRGTDHLPGVRISLYSHEKRVPELRCR